MKRDPLEPIFNLPKRTGRPATATVPVSESKWSYSGTVNPASNTFGQRWLPPNNLVLVSLVLTLYSAASVGTISVSTYINNVLTRTDTLANGSTSVIVDLGVPVSLNVPVYPRLLANATGNGVGLGIVYRWAAA